MKKNDIKFFRGAKNQIDNNSKKNGKSFFSDSNPIFIPKRKKRK